MPFGVTPSSGFPPPASDDFPQGLQFQFNGVNVGGTSFTTLNIVAGGSGQALSLTAGEGENAGVITLVIPVV